jgi:hypothetical protein
VRPPLDDEASNFSFSPAMSACMSFIIWITSARVGLDMVVAAGGGAGNGGAAVGGCALVVEGTVGREWSGEERLTRDTKLSRAVYP